MNFFVHICYEYDKCFCWYFLLHSLTYYQTRVQRIFRRCRCCHSFLSRALRCVRTGSSDQMIFVEVLSCFASNAHCSRFDNSTPFFFFACFCGKRVMRFISLSVLHMKNIYIFAFASLTAFLFIDETRIHQNIG